MQASSWVEQEQLDEKLAELEAQKAELAAQLHATHADLSAARSSAAAQEVTMRKLSEQLLKEGEAVVLLRAQLAKEQALVKTLKAKTSKVGRDWSRTWGAYIGGLFLASFTMSKLVVVLMTHVFLCNCMCNYR